MSYMSDLAVCKNSALLEEQVFHIDANRKIWIKKEYWSFSYVYGFFSIAGSWVIFALINQQSFLWISKDLVLIVRPCNAASRLFLFSSLPSSPILSLLGKIYLKGFLFSHFLVFLHLLLSRCSLHKFQYVTWLSALEFRVPLVDT